jgi:hypothetical protein
MLNMLLRQLTSRESIYDLMLSLEVHHQNNTVLGLNHRYQVEFLTRQKK